MLAIHFYNIDSMKKRIIYVMFYYRQQNLRAAKHKGEDINQSRGDILGLTDYPSRSKRVPAEINFADAPKRYNSIARRGRRRPGACTTRTESAGRGHTDARVWR
ncbi:hypothetical protein EVAR_91449_1 [Eumeta japonica]|uniref:Uncharacterized protein n=1 Tax=Eumeta variegata TaxID=151549 RepID=A0A4C1X3C7_EUMVA|nr:hypothetical protein EVAR_91449_1 [Eumeta japonica]